MPLVVGAAFGLSPAPLLAQNLVDSPGFETGTVSCSQQGNLPLPWLQAGLTTIGADTYSIDCGTRSGLDASWTNFANGFAPHCGLRWTAGGNNTQPLEALASPLLAPLQPNTTYLLAGWFRRNDRANVQGNTGYDVGFAPQPSLASTTVAVAGLAAGSAAFAWTEHTALFTTGPNPSAATHLVLAPVPGAGQTSYMGIDDLVLAPIGSTYSYPEGVVNDHALTATGSVAAGQSIQLSASSTLPGLPCVLAAGIDSACSPALGQTLLLAPIVTSWTPTDASGGATFSFTWPPGLPAGTRAYFQSWILDGAGGFSASNGIAAIGS